ncbi:MAG: IS110 family transposase [Gemmatimonadota bacterium]
MNSTQVGVDLAKSVFEVAVSDTPGRVSERRRLSRARLRPFFAEREPSQILLEACGSAHHWGRELTALGHRVTLLHPGDVARYRDGNKTDRADAKALLEACRNAALDPVPLKSIDQQAVAALHRLRQGCVRTRTARINAVRGHLREFGVSIPVGASKLVPHARAALCEGAVPRYLRAALEEALGEIEVLGERAESLRVELAGLAQRMPDTALLMSVPGVGVLSATALVAFTGPIGRFRTGRHFASYLGLTPREYSSGHTRRLSRITKRGNAYVRTLLVHGARSALRAGAASNEPDDLRAWALAVQRRSGHNKAAVALANKLARVCWRVWRDQRPFERRSAG